MKIEIDTSRDSPEDIRKAIAMLQALVGDRTSSSSSGEFDTGDKGSSAFVNMFGDSSSTTESSDTSETTETTDENKDETPEVMEY